MILLQFIRASQLLDRSLSSASLMALSLSPFINHSSIAIFYSFECCMPSLLESCKTELDILKNNNAFTTLYNEV